MKRRRRRAEGGGTHEEEKEERKMSGAERNHGVICFHPEVIILHSEVTSQAFIDGCQE